MAGVGVKLNRIFEKKSIAADMLGFVYSVVMGTGLQSGVLSDKGIIFLYDIVYVYFFSAGRISVQCRIIKIYAGCDLRGAL